jgi:hypothetical protein
MVTVGWDGFYTESSLYWSNRGDKYVGYALNVDIPAAFLCRTLESAIEQYSTYLKAKGKLPHAIHQAVFGDESLTHLDTLDYASVPATSSVRLKLRTR